MCLVHVRCSVWAGVRYTSWVLIAVLVQQVFGELSGQCRLHSCGVFNVINETMTSLHHILQLLTHLTHCYPMLPPPMMRRLCTKKQRTKLLTEAICPASPPPFSTKHLSPDGSSQCKMTCSVAPRLVPHERSTSLT